MQGSLRNARESMRSGCSAALFVAAVMLSVGSVHAAPCQVSADCPARFSCTTIGQTACGAPQACTGSNCPAAAPCETTDIRACKSLQCRSDRDCPDNMGCFSDAEGANCIPPYLAPCIRSTDCGDGFKCVPAVSTNCSGDAGSQCSSQRTGNYECQLQKITCASDKDCPSGFTCGGDPSVAACDDADGGVDHEGGACTSADRVCLPPYASVDFYVPRSTQAPANTWSNAPHGFSGHRHSGWSCSVSESTGSSSPITNPSAWTLAAGLGLALVVRSRKRRARMS